MFEDLELLAGEGSFEAIGKADEERFLIAGWSACDDADGAAWVHERIVRPANFDEGDDLGSGENVVRLVGHVRKYNNRGCYVGGLIKKARFTSHFPRTMTMFRLPGNAMQQPDPFPYI